MRTVRMALGVCLFGCLLLAVPDTQGAEPPKHPAMHKALYDLRQARNELRELKNDLGGHRNKAIAAIDDALVQIEKALVFQKDFNFKGLKDSNDKNDNKGKEGALAILRQTLESLREARAELSNAKNDFGGHKDKAINDIDEAILQIGLGVKSALKK